MRLPGADVVPVHFYAVSLLAAGRNDKAMEIFKLALFVFVRIHAWLGQEDCVWHELNGVVVPSGKEPGCVSIGVFRSIQDAQLFYIHSVWIDEAACEVHATLPHTTRFIELVDQLIDQPREVIRAERIG